MDSKIQVVYGFGAIDKYMTANGYIGLTALDIMRDVLNDENSYEASKILTKSIPMITKQRRIIFIPIYKYLSSVGIHSDEDYKNSQFNFGYKLKKGPDFKSYQSFTDNDKKKSLIEAIQTYKDKDKWKAVALIPYLEISNEDLPLLASFIENNISEFLV